jgi:hypothetical protein
MLESAMIYYKVKGIPSMLGSGSGEVEVRSESRTVEWKGGMEVEAAKFEFELSLS